MTAAPNTTTATPSVPASAGAGDRQRGPRRRRSTRAALVVARAVPIAILICAALAVLALAVGPRLGAYRTITILSGSMEPTFAPGDVIVSTKLPARDIRRGDVITFHAPVEGSPLVSHRVTRIVSGGAHPVIRTKGDNNPSGDPWSARIEQDVVWKQRAVIPYLGRAIHALRQPAVHAAVLYGSLALFLLVGLRAVWASPAPAASPDTPAGRD